MKSNIHD